LLFSEVKVSFLGGKTISGWLSIRAAIFKHANFKEPQIKGESSGSVDCNADAAPAQNGCFGSDATAAAAGTISGMGANGEPAKQRINQTKERKSLHTIICSIRN